MKIHTIQKEFYFVHGISQDFTLIKVDLTVRLSIHKIALTNLIIDHMFNLLVGIPLKERVLF